MNLQSKLSQEQRTLLAYGLSIGFVLAAAAVVERSIVFGGILAVAAVACFLYGIQYDEELTR